VEHSGLTWMARDFAERSCHLRAFGGSRATLKPCLGEDSEGGARGEFVHGSCMRGAAGACSDYCDEIPISSPA